MIIFSVKYLFHFQCFYTKYNVSFCIQHFVETYKMKKKHECDEQ